MRQRRRVPLSKRLWIPGLALLAGACGGSGYDSPTSPPMPQPAGVVTVEIDDFQFSPRSVQIQPGDRVRWVLRGSAAGHTVTAEDGSFDSGTAFGQPGATFEHTFGAEAADHTILYRCTSHYACCQMQGSVRVGAGAPPPAPGY